MPESLILQLMVNFHGGTKQQKSSKIKFFKSSFFNHLSGMKVVRYKIS